MKAKKTKEERLREYAEKHNCDAVMLTDGTIKKYEGERYTALAVYKLNYKKYYEWKEVING